MTGRSTRMRILSLALTGAALVAAPAHAAPPEPAALSPLQIAGALTGQVPAAAAVPNAKFLGSNLCSNCHATTPEKTIFNKAVGHIKLNEFNYWKEKDKHSLAFDNLKGERGAAMAKRLGLDVTRPEAGCLGCHSASATEKLSQGDAFKPSDGVSCENCHGAAEQWLTPHLDTSWRVKNAAQKAEFGMNDMGNPARQAAKCLSCHIGNSAEGKVVTHAMYSVGHPPLPSIEVAAFSDQLPRHWWLRSEKPEFKDKLTPGDDLERSKLAIVSAAVALKTSLHLLAEESKIVESAANSAPGLVWPDYARFDCASCHHELERPSWRQERGYTSAPGRPPVARWPLFIALLGVEKLGNDDPAAKPLLEELKGAEKTLNDAIRARPFGRAEDVGEAASKYAAWSDDLTKRLDAAKYDRKVVVAMLKRLVAEAADNDLDYDAARHVGWTIWSFIQDLGPDPKNEAEIKPILERIATGLRLNLPAGRDKKIEDQLEAALNNLGNYKPAALREDLKALGALLSY